MRLTLSVVLLLSALCSFAQTKQYQFAKIDMNEGLSHHTVTDILRDSSGFVWFATSSGLNRYDGYTIKVFKNIPGDTTSLRVDDLIRLYEGPSNKLWIFTHSGNIVYDRQTEQFHRNTDAILRQLSILPGIITRIHKDKRGRYWFMHFNQGLFLYDPEKKTTRQFLPREGDRSSIATALPSSFAEDSKGNIWLIHQNGIFETIDGNTLKVTARFEMVSERFRAQIFEYQIFIDSDDHVWIHSDRNLGCFYLNTSSGALRNFHEHSDIRLSSNIVKKILQDNEGKIWIATENGGINVLDKTDFSIQYLQNEQSDPKSIPENTTAAMYKDAEGIIWIGTLKNGVSYYHPNIFRFNVYKPETSPGAGLPFGDINAFAEDKSGNIWIGTNGGGLIRFNRNNKNFKQFLHDPHNPNSLSNNIIVSLLVDHEDALWIGTYYGGLNKFDGKRFIRYVHDPRNPKSLGEDNIWEIFEDSEYNLWLGTLKAGVDVFNRQREEFSHYRSNELNSIHTDYVPEISQDKEGNMWIGSGYGLEILDKNSRRFTHYLNDPSNPASLANNSILSLYEDSRGWMWIGSHGGLSKFDPASGKFMVLNEANGLAHNSVLTLTEDDDHNLWMSTPKGLSKLTIKKGKDGQYEFQFNNYNESDGLIEGAFHENAVLKCRSGELIFGGYNGFNIFHPRDIGNDVTTPRVMLTDFQVLNQSVKIGEVIDGNVVLPNSVSYSKSITLSPNNNFFSIEFAAMNFFHPEKSQYKYTLEGFNKGWLTTSANQRRVTYTNLDPGEYRFKVKATNSDGVWSGTETVLTITVLPPFWKTDLAFLLYAVGIICILLFARHIVVTRERLKFNIQNERFSAQRLHELDMMKIKFFTNVSHEFRTPLTLIITPLEKLLQNKAQTEENKQLQLIHRNARRLLNLVNQLLDFRKIEVEEVKLNPSEGDIVQFMRDLVVSFSDLSEKKNIQLSFNTSIDHLETLFDQDKMEKIIFNMLSNAFKFTPENGSVAVNLSMKNDGTRNILEIAVKDTGIGIPADKHQKIFERFFQHDLPESVVNQGSGIGLSITQEFVKLHGGTIDVESEVGKGSTFIVRLPIPDIHTSIKPEATDESASREIATISGEEAERSSSEDKRPVLLLIEDNEDFRFYLKDNLKLHYQVIESSNGRQGLEMAIATMPDLIVSDVMMPELNGIELCKKVKGDSRTSHIPVILLTARSSQEQKIEGFKAGANDYITKPFSFEILESRISNLLSLRDVSHKQFQKHFDIRVSDVQIASVDERLVNDAVKLVEDNLANSDFSVEEMSRMLAMSRVQLYKKLHSLTGKTPIEFIRFVRIQRAAQLLRKTNLTVSEVAYQVGFNNPKYFAKYFKEEFNLLPSAYASQEREKAKNAKE